MQNPKIRSSSALKDAQVDSIMKNISNHHVFLAAGSHNHSSLICFLDVFGVLFLGRSILGEYEVLASYC